MKALLCLGTYFPPSNYREGLAASLVSVDLYISLEEGASCPCTQ